jgi:outer membrane protein TolC
MRTLKGALVLAEVTALAMAILASPGNVVAQQARDTLTISQALEIARTANPALQAVRLSADASAERIAPAGAWPDPQLSFGLMNHSLDLGADQMMAMNSVQLVQRFPWPGKLGFAEQQARSLAEAARWESAESEAALLARVKAMYYQVAFMDRALAVMTNTRLLLREFHQASSALYAVGTGLQQDVLQAQVAIASMTEDITVMSQNRVAMTARLNGLLGRPPTVEVDALQLPPPGGGLPSVDSLMGIAVEQRPALHAARARAEAAEAGYRAARRAVYPDFAVTLGYGQRPQYDDLATIMVGISIPLWAGSRHMPLRREMEAVQAMETGVHDVGVAAGPGGGGVGSLGLSSRQRGLHDIGAKRTHGESLRDRRDSLDSGVPPGLGTSRGPRGRAARR